MPNTAIFLDVYWLGSLSNVSHLVQSLVSADGALNSATTMPGKMTNGQKVWTGGGTMGADYRGRLAIATAVEHGELVDYSPAKIGDWSYGTLKANYVFWVRNTWAGPSSRQWTNGILPYLKTNPPVRTGCPTSYGWCVK
jgi:hypothetical protein